MLGHPIARVGLLLVAFRLSGLSYRYLIQPAAPLSTRLALFVPAVAFHAGTLLTIVAVSLACAMALSRLGRSFSIVACLVLALLMIAGQADLVVSSITGAPLTPTVFRTYRGIQVVTSNEFLEPLRANWMLASAGLGIFVAILAWIGRMITAGGRRDPASKVTLLSVAAWGGAGIVLVGLANLAAWPTPPPPIEVAFAREYLGFDTIRLRGSEADAFRELRELVGLPPGARWVSDQYPLVYQSAPATVPTPGATGLPDIVVIMVESLRAEDLAFVTGARESATPNLDRLAARSIVFPTYISNGFPSAPSLLSFHASAWPHRRKEIITDFASRAFDSIPARLRGLGYETIYVGADPHFDNQDVWLRRWYGTVVDLVARGASGTDRTIVSHAMAEIRRHDAEQPDKPLFTFVSTYSTHYPFRLPADANEEPVPPSAGLPAQYRQVLRYTDREVAALVLLLESRPRRDRTVTIVVGDHAFYTDLRRTSGLPENDNQWTAAMIAGPERLVGPPRRIAEPASHVDMLPTILALVGDTRPSAALGGNLLGPARTGVRTALAVRPGGVRLDRGGLSVMVDARTPNLPLVRPAFPILAGATLTRPGDTAHTRRVMDWVNSWSYLIENNRVWNDGLLNGPAAP